MGPKLTRRVDNVMRNALQKAFMHSRPPRPRFLWSVPRIAILGADQKERGLWGREWCPCDWNCCARTMLQVSTLKNLFFFSSGSCGLQLCM